MTQHEILQKIKHFILREFPVNHNGSEPIEQVDLFENEYIDSLGLMKLVSFFEEEFRIDFDESHLYDERFVNIEGQSAIIGEIIYGK
ncbi:MAG: acyl carrier protein [Candidatus Aminicenantes bacterium]|jgi:acyl carrier protein